MDTKGRSMNNREVSVIEDVLRALHEWWMMSEAGSTQEQRIEEMKAYGQKKLDRLLSEQAERDQQIIAKMREESQS